MRNCKYLIIFFIAFLPAKLFAQTSLSDVDITGLWKGTLYNDTTKKFYRYEIGISEEKGKLSGFSHTFFLVEDKEFYGVKKVKIKRKDGKIIIEDAGLLANNYPEEPAKGVKQLNVLTLEIKDSIMTLSGPFSTNRTKQFSSLTGTISLQRKNDFWQSALVPHLQELGLSNELSFVKKENDRVKEEADKKVAQKDVVTNNKQQEIKKESKLSVSSKDVAANKAVTKKDPSVETKSSESNQGKSTETKNSKPVPATKEPAKEEKATASTPAKATSVNDDKASKAASKDASNNSKSKESKPENRSSENEELKKQSKEKITTPVKSNAPAAEVAIRKNVVQQIVYYNSDSLQLSLYDNGEVDGDTVSVLMNGKIIMAKEGLSTNAVRKTIYAGETDSLELVMYAENLGSIPPNTGLLVVHDGKNIYEIRFSGDLQKNAAIILRRKK